MAWHWFDFLRMLFEYFPFAPARCVNPNKVAAMTTDRLGPMTMEQMDQAQRTVAQAVIAGPRGALYGPFVPLLRSPELMECAQRMGEYLRYRSAIGTRLSELAILVTARQWNQAVEWAIHAPIAVQTGLSELAVQAIAARRRPDDMKQDEAEVYEFCIELHQHQRVSDATYARVLARHGERAVVDLMGINGYYTFLSMVMNAAQTAAPQSSAPALPA
jgi:4-carboxymuconolactone decarboxylase